ncbi:MAG: hypothetical protein AAGF89_08625 [Bacteroidota bacterium]
MPSRRRQALIALFFAAVFLLNYPLLLLAESWGEGFFPWPILYLLIVWVGVIAGVGYLSRGKKRGV